jgi:transglutaminase-like putative cysteine protease
VVVPPERYGDQRLREHRVGSQPTAERRLRTDRFGNLVYEFDLGEVGGEIAFDVETVVERAARPRTPRLSRADVRAFAEPTPLTAADEEIADFAAELAGAARTPVDLADRAYAWASDALDYEPGVTGVETTAAEALALGSGRCQDYTHLMIAVCRAAGLPARYVSGHMVGEGGSHAWVEVLVPSAGDGEMRPVAYDPTNRQMPHLGYVTVAVGRDSHDVPPTSGTFLAPCEGRLSFTKHAGLSLVVMADGEVLRAK